MLCKILGIFGLCSFIYSAAYATEYMLINFTSNGLIVNSASGTEIGGGDIKKNEKGEIALFSKKACKKALNNEIEELKDFEQSFVYHENGIYEIDGNFGRLCCISTDKLDKEDIGTDPLGFYIEIDSFFDKYKTQFPSEIDKFQIDSYKLFPLD
ncbi:MAG: hypothetical protein MJ187_03600 [Alphaproteobacteria bacterium]|nr:hypothetical protein [Alphaproteobacteria bacterium]